MRYVGFTGHKDPEIHLRMLSFDYPFDACQLPLNGFDAHFRSFQKRVLPELARRQIAAIGMKSLGGDGRVIKKKRARVGEALRYAMSLPVCTTVSGIDSMKVLRQNLRRSRAAFSPMTARQRGLPTSAASRKTRPTDDSSCTRRPPSTREKRDGSSTGSRRRKSWGADGIGRSEDWKTARLVAKNEERKTKNEKRTKPRHSGRYSLFLLRFSFH